MNKNLCQSFKGWWRLDEHILIPTENLLKMKAFHNNAKLKKDMVSEILNHQKQDQILKGTYATEENGKWRGCAVGCSVHSLNMKCGKNYETGNHKVYETELGIPESLARLEDYLFEIMPQEAAMKWPAEFMKAIPVGANLSLVAPKFIVGTLKEVVKLEKVKDDKAVVKAVLDIAKLWEEVIAGKNPKSAAWIAAWIAARSATESAAWSATESAAESAGWSAARSAAWSATESAARSATESAAESAAWSAAWSAAESAAWSAAESAARSAGWSAARSAARSAAESAAESAATYKMSRRLLKTLRSCK